MNARLKTFSLRTRLTVLLAVAVLVVLGTAARIVDWRADADMQQRFDASLLARAQAFAELVPGGENDVQIDAIADRVATFPGGAPDDWYAVQCQGKVIAQSHPAPPFVAGGAAPRFVDARLATGRELRVVAFRFHPGGNDGANVARTGAATSARTCELRYAIDRGPLENLLHTLDWTLLGSLLGACLLVVLLTPWLVHRGLRPFAMLDRAMSKIGPDAPGGRLPASGTTELVPVVTRFNEVLARMDAGLARERQFAAGLAHEFRTRLAELRALVDVESRYPSGHDIPSVLAEVGSIGAELEATVTALLQLTRIQSRLEQTQRERVLVAPLVARVQARQRDAAQARNISVASSTDLAPTFAVETDSALLEIVLDNLLGNAVAYAPAGSTITLHGDRFGIRVVNPAPGLESGDLANFGQRFWRKGAQGQGHAGLGLALAGAAARELQMTLNFKLDDGELCATLRWRA